MNAVVQGFGQQEFITEKTEMLHWFNIVLEARGGNVFDPWWSFGALSRGFLFHLFKGNQKKGAG